MYWIVVNIWVKDIAGLGEDVYVLGAALRDGNDRIMPNIVWSVSDPSILAFLKATNIPVYAPQPETAQWLIFEGINVLVR